MHSQSDSPSLPSQTRELTERLRPFGSSDGMALHHIASHRISDVSVDPRTPAAVAAAAGAREIACLLALRHHP